MSDNFVNATSSGHLAEGILGVLLLIVSFLFKRSLNYQDNKIEDNRREIKLVSEKYQKELKDIYDIIRQTDHYISDIQSDVAFIRGKMTNKDSDSQ